MYFLVYLVERHTKSSQAGHLKEQEPIVHLSLSVQDSEPFVAIDKISTRYSSTLVSIGISFDFQIVVSYCISLIARSILLLMSCQC